MLRKKYVVYNQMRYFTDKGNNPKEDICMFTQGIFEDSIKSVGRGDAERQNSVNEISERSSESFHEANSKFEMAKFNSIVKNIN